MELPSPDDISEILNTPFVTAYWPLILGVIAIIIVVVKGKHWLALPIVIAAVAGEAWHLGMFN